MLLLSILLFVFSVNVDAAENVRLLLKVTKAKHSAVEQSVRNMAGTVRYKYKYIDAMAVTLPMTAVDEILSSPDVLDAFKDLESKAPEPPSIKRVGYGTVKGSLEANASFEQGFSSPAQIEAFLSDLPDNLDPFTNDLTNSLDVFFSDGLTGAGVIVGIMDSGFRPGMAAYSDRVVGAENFVPVEPALDDGLPAIASLNGNHGSNVASCVGAAAIFGFLNTSTFAQAIALHAPNSVIIDLFGAGTIGIPMIGQAPGCSFFGLKVFNRFGSTSNSILMAAMERAIELKTKFDKGQAGGVNLQIVNMSFNGATLNAGDDPFFAQLVEQMTKAGIVCVHSAGNDGPSTMSGGDPATAENVLTVGASNDYVHERILRSAQFGLPIGALWRPVENNFVADFSSRGPTPDGRSDPEIAAPGFARFAQGGTTSATGLVLTSGTSFSAPTVAGIAALLLEDKPNAKPDQIRGALLTGANPNLLDNAGKHDQGFGFVDATGALTKLRANAKNPKDKGRSGPSVRKNIQGLVGSKNIITKNFNGSVNLDPGEHQEYFIEVDSKTREVSIAVTGITPHHPTGNPLFGDDLNIAVHSAKTSTFNGGEYLFLSFVSSDLFLTFAGEELDLGLMRLTIRGSGENAGNVSANVNIQKVKGDPDYGDRIGQGRLKQGEVKTFTLNMPAGASEAAFTLDWNKHWGEYPTNDLDMFITDPSFGLNFDGATLNAPERAVVASPEAGEWIFDVIGFTVWQKPDDSFRLYANVDVNGLKLAGEATLTDSEIRLLPTEFGLAQNYPNPFNPETTIQYGLPQAADVKLQIFNIRGQLVRTLVEEFKPAGFYSLLWDGKDSNGLSVPSGAYFYRIQAGNEFVKTNKMTLLK
jgi:subtilisin family serine protease